MGRRTLLAVAGWLATAVVATLIGLAAIRLVGESLTGTPGGVRSQEEIARALAEPAPGTDPPGSVPTGAPAPGSTTTGSGPGGSPSNPVPPADPSADSGDRRGFSTLGGSAVAECRPDGVYLVSWSARPGYRVDDVDRGPDDDADVTFVGPSGEYELSVRCVGGVPTLDVDD
ncbi:septum formation initiator [Verrucosispora sp. WMMA2044]|uniref:Septum formation initiator n=1 Tax=Verrucosispora sioxanthis TaxID=2499994 RepID=A0A6M1KXC0_9ACTN|nr:MULTISPECIES: septum formation initiator [Micromonospora]NEE62992.1 septum formation initiator [Verrucosispora sioxanthis]NGM12102.1 septum formation initiator [Verrucosispora sioxanthis]WBB47384.1 septum formation initiator [Verrucosispora sp. WMMA2044]